MAAGQETGYTGTSFPGGMTKIIALRREWPSVLAAQPRGRRICWSERLDGRADCLAAEEPGELRGLAMQEYAEDPVAASCVR